MKTKNSYNPFKMWGSYAGAVLLWLSWKIVQNYDGTGIRSILYWINKPIFIFLTNFVYFTLHLYSKVVFNIAYLIFGFILGYGIHSLIRKVRK